MLELASSDNFADAIGDQLARARRVVVRRAAARLDYAVPDDFTQVADWLQERAAGSVEGRKNESERYRKIIRRAKRVRERAAASLRRSRALRKTQGDLGEQAEAAKRRRKFRRQD